MKPVLILYRRTRVKRILIALFIVLAQSACKKGNDHPDYVIGSNENINTWILDSLKRYYYWNQNLPAKPDLNVKPQDFFNTIKNRADRFSYLFLPNDLSTYPSSNRKFGFDYATVEMQQTGQVIGVIKLVLNESPASRAGLKRGDYILKVNGQQLSTSNAVSLQQEILSADKFSLGLAEYNAGKWVDSRSVEVNLGAILDQPQISKIFEIKGKKIGYMYLQDFNSGLASSLLTQFADYKNKQINDLIIDLRYNAGGQVAEAAGICALIAPSVRYDAPFIIYQGNQNGGRKTESFGRAATFDKTANFDELITNNLKLSRVFILGTAATASASEVIINNLKPYMQVLLIGETTRGKDEASFKITDERIPKQVTWEMHPIVYKLLNASGQGGYSSGISPDVFINELDNLPLLPFGDINDPLIKTALLRITGLSKLSEKQSVAISAQPALTKIITDTRRSSAESSVVITHR